MSAENPFTTYYQFAHRLFVDAQNLTTLPHAVRWDENRPRNRPVEQHEQVDIESQKLRDSSMSAWKRTGRNVSEVEARLCRLHNAIVELLRTVAVGLNDSSPFDELAAAMTEVRLLGAAAGNVKESPAFDSTPRFQRPDSMLIDAAYSAIPRILDEMENTEGETIGNRNERVVNAFHLVQELEKSGHTKGSAHWAVHKRIEAGHLLVSGVLTGGFEVWGGDRGHMPAKVWRSIPKGDDYSTFNVRSTSALWESRMQQASTTAIGITNPSPIQLVPRPLQTSGDIARLLNALRDWYAAYSTDEPLASKTSQALDSFRRSFCHPGDTPPTVSVDGKGLPDLVGLSELIQASGACLTVEARDKIHDLYEHGRGLGIWWWMVDDRQGTESAESRERRLSSKGGDTSALRKMRTLLRETIAILEPFAPSGTGVVNSGRAPVAPSTPGPQVSKGENDPAKMDAPTLALKAYDLTMRLGRDDGSLASDATDEDVYNWLNDHHEDERIKPYLPVSLTAFKQALRRGRDKTGIRKRRKPAATGKSVVRKRDI